MEATTVLAAGLVLARQSGSAWQYLLLQSTADTAHWGPPKVNLKDGESVDMGARRALTEKTDLSTNLVHFVDGFNEKVDYTYQKNDDSGNRQIHKEVTYTLAKYTGSDHDNVQLDTSNHKAFKWEPLSQAKDSVGYQNMKDLLDKAEQKLNTSAKK